MRQGRFGVAMRLGAAFGVALLLLAVFVSISQWQRHALEQELNRVANSDLERIRLVDRWVALSEATSLRILAVNKSNDPTLAEFFGEDIGRGLAEIGELLRQVEAGASTPEERAWLDDFAPKRAALLTALKEVEEFKQLGDVAGASVMFDRAFVPAQQAYGDAIRRYGELQREALDRKMRDLLAAGERDSRLLMALVVAFVAVGLLVSWRTIRHIKRSLDEAVAVARAVAAGDLSHRAAGRADDEFGELMQALAGMSDSLERIVREVRDGTEGITTASGEIAQGNTDLSSRTEMQAGNLQQTAAAMQELTTTVQHNASTARQASALAQQATAVAARGGEAVSGVVGTMADISASSRRIEEIIGVIDGISFQTNILALNAAVEAARAGEQGRGFSVVAGEVRTLAQRSATAAREIKALIGDSADKVRSGTELVENAGRTMGEIVQAIEQVSRMMLEINTAAEQQHAGIAGVSRSVSVLDQMTQQNAALVEQASAAAESMRQQALTLDRAVAVFRLSGS